MDIKQIAYKAKKIRLADTRLRLLFTLSVLAIIAIPAIVITIHNNHDIDTVADLFAWITGGGAFVKAFSMASVGNQETLSDRLSAPNQISHKVWLLEVHQIDSSVAFPSPDANLEISDITLNTGEYWHYFEAIADTLNDNQTGEKGEITTTVTNTFDFIMASNPKKLLEFLNDHSGGHFIIVYKDVTDGEYKLMGTLDKPMVLQNFERKNGKDGKYVTLKFQNTAFQVPYTYTGNLTQENPVTVDADTTTLAVTTNPNYQLTDNTGATVINAVSGLADADKGRVISILGSGGDNPSTIAENSTFILVDSSTWTANSGSRISFKVLDSNTLVEVAGSRVQTA